MIILASSIAGTRYRRIREVVVLKTLGATRARIATVFSIEFAVLGLVAGVVGIGFANVIARVLLKQLSADYRFHWMWSLLALMGTAALTVGRDGWRAIGFWGRSRWRFCGRSKAWRQMEEEGWRRR